MTLGRKTALPWEHCERSPGGLWVKTERCMESIALRWQPRIVASAGRVQTFDANGVVMSDVPVSRVKWSDPWVLAGEVPLDEAFVLWAGVPRFDACAYGTMRHMAGLVACGYGDDPGDVVDWFRDLGELQWLVDGVTYRIVGGEEFEGLNGSSGEMTFDEDDVPVFQVAVGVDTYPIRLDSQDMLRAVLCSVFPSIR